MGILITAPQDRAYERGLAEGIETGLSRGKRQGREEGAAEERERVQDWFRRYMEAKARGEPFDEDPPEAP